MGRGEDGLRGKELPCFTLCTFKGSGQEHWDIWSSEVEENGEEPGR